MPIHNEEAGLTPLEFKEGQEALKKEVEKYASLDRERPTKLYFKFDSPKIRNEAIELLRGLNQEHGEFDDAFRYFKECDEDPNPEDVQAREVGIEISFSKNPEGLKDKIELILKNQGFIPREAYTAVDDEPRPEETVINN